MADASDPTSGGEDAFALLSVAGIPNLINDLIRLGTVARERGHMTLYDEVGALLDGLLQDINAVAAEIAGFAEGAVVGRIYATTAPNRPQTNEMEQHIKALPGPLGSVRVGILSELDKIVNPRGGFGPFWRAQEFGTGGATGGVPSQIGRPLFGTYDPSGSPPDSAQRGLRAGHDLAFVPMGTAPGFGRISVDLPGRHFLKDGSEAAGAEYIKRMQAVQDKWLSRLRAMMAQVKANAARGGSFTGRIEA